MKMLGFHQLSWLERFPPLASQAKFWELLKEEHFLINRGIAKKSTALRLCPAFGDGNAL